MPPVDNTTSAAPPGKAKRKPIYRSLFFQVFVAIVAGISVGHLFPDLGADLRPLGDGFIKLIKMLIAPMIFCVVVTGIAHVGDLKSVGRIGVKALIYFEVVTTFALVFGLLIGNVRQAGRGLQHRPEHAGRRRARRSPRRPATASCRTPSSSCWASFPTASSAPSPRTTLLQVLFFAVLFGIALAKFGEHRQAPVVFELIEQFTPRVLHDHRLGS